MKTPLKKSELQSFKKRLLQMRARISADVNQMTENALSGSHAERLGSVSSMPIHMADLGTDNFEQEFTLSLIESDNELLDKIEHALERIEEGSYGTCEECGGRIPKMRLNALPYATMCVKCAEKFEKGR